MRGMAWACSSCCAKAVVDGRATPRNATATCLIVIEFDLVGMKRIRGLEQTGDEATSIRIYRKLKLRGRERKTSTELQEREGLLNTDGVVARSRIPVVLYSTPAALPP